jgi:hypothetical protein
VGAGGRIASLALPAWLLVLGVTPAGAVVIDALDGSANTSPPPSDPGFAHVGNKEGLTAVYIGRQWVLTAAHVPSGPVVLGGVRYEPVPDSRVQLRAVGRATAPPDLALFQIAPEPPLPSLPIRADPPAIGLPVAMIGNGANRGAPVTWTPPPGPSFGGYLWGVGHSVRWGTNAIHEVDVAPEDPMPLIGLQTDAISTEFTQGAGPHECQAANGDSGGGLFIEDGGTWELAGIVFGVGTHSIENPAPPPASFSQPASTALYGNLTYAADLSVYRDQILAVRDAPEIPALPAWGSGLLAAGLAAAGRAAVRRPRR